MLVEKKYEVFKAATRNPDRISTRLGEGSFFVLREGDALALMTLRSHVSNALQILDWDIDPTTGRELTKTQRDYLEEIADGTADLAVGWSNTPSKIPD
jgi:hypothetical protein